MPATDEEVYEVEDLLDVGKSTRNLADTGKDVECTPNNKCSSGTAHLKGICSTIIPFCLCFIVLHFG